MEKRTDYTKLDPGTMLETLGQDASKWAAAFMQFLAERKGDLDEGFMLAWFANAIEQGHRTKMNRAMNASEAVYGFASWLTTREEKVTFSAHDECSHIAELVSKFVETNELDLPRHDWTTRLTHPEK